MVARISLTLLVFIVSMSQPVYAKAPTAQVTITGPRLSTPLHASDPAITVANVWGGNFIDWEAGAVASPDADLSQYRIHFWINFGPDDFEMMYVLDYQWVKDSDRAIVCLPGRRDIWYRINTHTILRAGQDGNCYYTEDKWGRAVYAAIRKSF
jgi:hypothetical protein